MQVDRRTVTSGLVWVSTRTEERREAVTVDLRHSDVVVERVPVGRRIDAVPEVRQEGDLTIIPVVEEVVVVERRLMLVEEVRVRRVERVESRHEEIVLRKQHADIRRDAADEQATGVGPDGALKERVNHGQ